MEKVAEKRDREIRPGFALSILLHVLFVAIFLLPLFPAPPEAKPEQSVNVELVPQQEEKQELATKANEKPDQPPKPTPKPDEKPAEQTAETQQEPQQPEGKKADEQPPKPSDPSGKKQAEKPAAKPDEAKADKPVEQAKSEPKPDDPAAEKPVEKAEQQPPVVDVPVPDMNGDQKNPTTTQQADTSEQRNNTPPMQPNNAAAEQQAEAQAATDAAAQAQAAQQAQDTLQRTDAKDQMTNATEPPASDSNTKALSSAPDVLTTKEPSDFQVQPPQAASSDLKQQAPAEQVKNETKDLPQIVVPAVKPSPSQQSSQEQSASISQGDPTAGTALFTEAQPKSDAMEMAVRARKLYSDVEMARLSKSNYDAWKKMPRRERVSYLCRSEALAQFGHEFNAPNYVNSAFSPTMLSDTGVSADGVAVPTSKGWYRVAFRCQVDDAALKVTAFSYTSDGRVPKNQLERLGLPAF
ncbi:MULTISPECIES: DUF930 domain-containing protein [Rhizobium]|uniref:DUF930 domain-containing protein n=1 Tax=Rhizobium tropici TaxID=398 RepID=A0A6P1BZ11_RHITR|nr:MULTISPECIES: DUF930 domain-containing protein [Rhizobium]AGB71856.1 putative proline rich protein [Rhizobium tropici CIAT 899]MBB5593272.1 hypothetical protein [Rhizobium tropici]NEV09788.1 DUF930 domain-containing protein [Rhizobium tropici]TGE95989.1 DUF930 domain-containing protein [Rhizobium sp. SEMIA 4088]